MTGYISAWIIDLPLITKYNGMYGMPRFLPDIRKSHFTRAFGMAKVYNYYVKYCSLGM